MKMNGAEILVNVLMEQGVTDVFGYPGGAVLHIYDALYKHSDKITHRIAAHEQGASHAADGYARVTGKTGVVIATSGPGATNLVTGIATAYMDSIPMVAITGNVGSSLIGRDSFQEVYTMGITMPITKHNYTVSNIADLAEIVRSAFRIANSGRKGPVLIDITKDVTINMGEYEPKTPEKSEVLPEATDEDISKLVALLNEATRPLVIFGGGVVSSGASQLLYKTLHKANIPAAHTIMATGVLSWDDPLNLGLVGMHGRYSGNRAIDETDLLITIGFRFSDRVALSTGNFAAKAKIVQIDIDPSEINKNVNVSGSIVGDIGKVLAKFLPALPEMQHEEWMGEIAEWRAMDILPAISETQLRPRQIIETVCDMAGEDMIMVTDVGQHQMWAAQYCKRTKPRSFLTSGGLGTMGFGYGAAIGAQVAAPQRKVVHVTGDGSFHMNLNECCTAVTYELPIITIIMNNNVLGMVRQWQTTFYGQRYSSTTLNRKTDYVKLAEGFGAAGFHCETPAEFDAAFTQALKATGPVWIECVIDMDEQVLPMIPAGGALSDMITE